MAVTTSDSERELLRTIRARTKAGKGVRVGIGDDCAVLRPPPGDEILVTTDFSIEGRHFHLDTHPPEAIGHKCLARGLSDIAGMGGRPLAAFVSLAVPRALTQPQKRVRRDSRLRHETDTKPRSWMERFYDGLLALAESEQVTLAGGDLSESPAAVADIIVMGTAPRGRAILRSTARAGDILYVTGVLGGAAAELATLKSRNRKTPANSLEHPHFYPQPRLAAGQALLRRRLATACIDISDGLSVDLLHLCEESALDAEIDTAGVPIHPKATIEEALHGGDDYELLFTASSHARMPGRLGGVAIYPIGRMVARRPQSRASRMMLVSSTGKKSPLSPQGWQHF